MVDSRVSRNGTEGPPALTSLDELRDAKLRLENAGVTVDPVDHVVTKSIYFDDPDGNSVELYVDASDAWKRDPQLVARAAPMEL
jgi:catechol 2,3-dioxygenase